jgi:hypothetical protein
MTFICWSERCILTAGLEIILLISLKADDSIVTNLLSLRFGFPGVYRKPPFWQARTDVFAVISQKPFAKHLQESYCTYFDDDAVSLLNTASEVSESDHEAENLFVCC